MFLSAYPYFKSEKTFYLEHGKHREDICLEKLNEMKNDDLWLPIYLFFSLGISPSVLQIGVGTWAGGFKDWVREWNEVW